MSQQKETYSKKKDHFCGFVLLVLFLAAISTLFVLLVRIYYQNEEILQQIATLKRQMGIQSGLQQTMIPLQNRDSQYRQLSDRINELRLDNSALKAQINQLQLKLTPAKPMTSSQHDSAKIVSRNPGAQKPKIKSENQQICARILNPFAIQTNGRISDAPGRIQPQLQSEISHFFGHLGSEVLDAMISWS